MRRIFFPRLVLLAGLLFSLAATSCASTDGRGPAKTVDDMYAQAVTDLKDGLYPEALDAFETIKARFPYSKYAALSDLRIADVHYERQAYVEAIDAYRNFLKYHPTHSEAPYAMFRIAEAYQQQMPSDFFILPPSAEKDQAQTKLAISAFRDMLNRYPTSEYAEKAQEKLNECRKKLADHEMYVARFYFKHEKWVASALRAEGVLRDYNGLGLDAEALWIAGRSRYSSKELVEARVHLSKLEAEFKDSPEAGKAKSVLEEMDKKKLDAKPEGESK
jgi:outer membrane protein assembly factor BamD